MRVQGGERCGDRAGFRLRAVVEWVIVISIFGRDTWRCPGRNYAPYSCSTPPMGARFEPGIKVRTAITDLRAHFDQRDVVAFGRVPDSQGLRLHANVGCGLVTREQFGRGGREAVDTGKPRLKWCYVQSTPVSIREVFQP